MHQAEDSRRIQRSALLAGTSAFVAWGLAPAYWKLLKTVPALEILAHRFICTVVFLGMLLTWQRRLPEVLRNLRSRRASLFCLSSGLIMGVTWGLFIWTVIVGRVLETSLGYFMTPILNVLLGALVLRERLSPWQLASILIASAGGAISHIWLRSLPVGGRRALSDIRSVRFAAKAIRHPSRFGRVH